MPDIFDKIAQADPFKKKRDEDIMGKIASVDPFKQKAQPESPQYTLVQKPQVNDPFKAVRFTQPVKPTEVQPELSESMKQYVSYQLAQGRTPEQIQADIQGAEANPWVDLPGAVAAAAGGGIPGLISRAGTMGAGRAGAELGLRALIAAATEYPIGQAADIVAEENPLAAQALALGVGLASGKFVEAPISNAVTRRAMRPVKVLNTFGEEVEVPTELARAMKRGDASIERSLTEGEKAANEAARQLAESKRISEALSMDAERYRDIRHPADIAAENKRLRRQEVATINRANYEMEHGLAGVRRKAPVEPVGTTAPEPPVAREALPPRGATTAEKITSEAALASGGLPAGGVPSQAGGLKPSSIEGSNIERRLEAKWETTRAHKETAQVIMDDYRDYIFSGRRGGERGVVKTADDIKLANELGLDKSKLGTELPTGLRLRQLHTAITENIDNIREIANAKLSGRATDTDMARLTALVEETATFKRYLTGELAEWGRAGKMLQQMSRSGETISRIGDFSELTGADGIFNERTLKRLTEITSPKDIENIYRPNWWDKFFEYYSNAILSNPMTHIVNSVGNAIMVGIKPIDAFSAAAVDWARAGIKGTERTRFAREGLQQLSALKSGFGLGLKSALRTFNEFEAGRGVEEAAKLDASRMKPFAIEGKKGKYARGMWRLLSTEDAFFKAIVGQMELHSLAYRKASKAGLKGEALQNRMAQFISAPTPDMLKQIEIEKTFRAYQTPIKGVSKSIASIRNWELPGTGAKPFQMVLPFITTPINLAKEGLRRTPVGFTKTILSRKNLTPEQFAEDLAKGAIGSAIFGGMIMAAANGNVTGGGPSDKAERDALYRTGWQPYSIKVGDTYYSYQRIEPFGMILGLAADTYEGAQLASDQESTWKEVAAKAGFGIGRNILSKTYMQGLQETLDAVQEPDRYADKFLQRRISSALVPQTGSYLAALDDPYLREINSIADAVKMRIPGERGSLLPKYDIWGRKIKRDGPLWYRAMSPLYLSTQKGDRVDDELVRIELYPLPPGKTVGNVRLTDAQYNEYQRVAGQMSRRAVEQVMASDGYRSAPDDVRKDLISKVIREQRGYAREQLKPKWGIQ